MLATILPLVALLVVYGSLGLIAWRRSVPAIERPRAIGVVSIGPALRASRMRASEALRIVG